MGKVITVLMPPGTDTYLAIADAIRRRLGIFSPFSLTTIRFIVSGLSLQGAPFYVESLSLGVLLILVIIYELLVETPEAKARLQRWRRLWAEPPQAAAGA